VTARVGVLGDGADGAADAIRDAGGEAVTGEAALDESAVDVVAAIGEAAVLDALAAGVGVHQAAASASTSGQHAEQPGGTSVLPVAAGREYGGVERDDLPDALTALASGDYEVRERPTLSVTAGETDVRALADVMLVTDEPARISEYAVATRGSSVDEVRADGVVVATPAGSHGYAADAGGPLLSADAGALAVVPISPFRVERTQWVLDAPASLEVVREDADVALLVDGRERGLAEPGVPVELDWGAPFEVAVVPASRPAGFA